MQPVGEIRHFVYEIILRESLSNNLDPASSCPVSDYLFEQQY